METQKVKDAFNQGSDKYDNYRKQAIPLMDEFYQTAIDLTKKYNNPKILDLGAGTGILTELLSKQHPESEITLIDMSHEMLEKARKKFENKSLFNYIEANYLTYNFPEQYDIIISSLSIHHLTDDEKQDLYEKIYNHLLDGGIFINADQVRGATDKTEQLYKEKDESHLQAQDMPESEKEILHNRRKLDKPATLSDTIEWYKEIGYVNVDVFFKYYRYFVISGQK
ncbi:class I SAM-dependent methyltransferase [Methanosphaera sp.]